MLDPLTTPDPLMIVDFEGYALTLTCGDDATDALVYVDHPEQNTCEAIVIMKPAQAVALRDWLDAFLKLVPETDAEAADAA